MSTIILRDVQPRFPTGTNVGAYLRTQWPAVPVNPSGAPTGAAVETAAVAADGTLTYTTLADDTVYVAYAEVSATHRLIAFIGPEADAGGATEATALLIESGVDDLETRIGATDEAAASGNGGLNGLLKRIRNLLGAGLPTALIADRLVVHSPRTTQDPVDAAGAAIVVKFAAFSATADGDNTIVAAVGGKKIRVLGYLVIATGAGVVTLQDITTGTDRAAIRSGGDGQGAVFVGSLECPAFDTATGEGLEVNNPAGVDSHGHVTYIEV
jgi:hypothetical protein